MEFLTIVGSFSLSLFYLSTQNAIQIYQQIWKRKMWKRFHGYIYLYITYIWYELVRLWPLSALKLSSLFQLQFKWMPLWKWHIHLVQFALCINIMVITVISIYQYIYYYCLKLHSIVFFFLPYFFRYYAQLIFILPSHNIHHAMLWHAMPCHMMR